MKKFDIPEVLHGRAKSGMDWDQMAAEAEFEIARAKSRIAALKNTVRFCRDSKAAGVPFPVPREPR